MTHTPDTEVYEAPSVHAYGSVAALTAADECGDTTDQQFAAGTPLSQLTCS